MITIIEDIPTLETYREKWNELLTMAGDFTPFQTFDYVYSAWKIMPPQNGKLYILCYVRQKDNKLLAICPFYIDTKRTLRFINDIHTDFCDVIVCEDSKGDYHLWEEISNEVLSCKYIKSLCLNNVRGESLMLSSFNYFLKPSLIYSTNSYSCVHFINRNDYKSVVDVLPALRSKERARLRNIYQKIDSTSHVIYSKDNGDVFPEKHVITLISQMLDLQLRTQTYFNNDMIELFRKLYEDGLMQVHVTNYSNGPVAANLWLHIPERDEYIDWIALYAQKGKNLDNLLQSFDHIARNGGFVNFARGTYQYKMHNFRPVVYNLYTLRWSKSIWGQVGDLFAMNLYHIKQIVKKIIRK